MDLSAIFPNASRAFLELNNREPAQEERPLADRVLTVLRAQLEGVDEKGWGRFVESHATSRGWGWFHVSQSTIQLKSGKRVGDGKVRGMPDYLLWRDRFIARELKTDRGKLSAAQQDVIAAWAAAGVDVGVWRPRDLERVLAELA